MPEPRITEFALPGILQEIARLSTPEIAIVVAREWGGRRLYVPRTLGTSHPLAQKVGRRAALLICAHLGGEQIEIPAARTYLRWYDARRLKAEGRSYAEISRAIGVSTRQVAILLRGFESGDALVPADTPHQAEICPLCQHKVRPPQTRRGDPRQLDLYSVGLR